MRHESQEFVIGRLRAAIAGVELLPEPVVVRTVTVSRHTEELGIQIDADSFREMFAGTEVYRYCGGTMANGYIGDSKFYTSIIAEPEAVIDGPYVMPALETAKGQ